MSSLDATFEELLSRLGTPSPLDPRRGDPILYFVYPPENALAVKQRIPLWAAQVRERGYGNVRVLSLSRMAHAVIDEDGQWDDWVAAEADFDLDQVNGTVTNVLSDGLLRALERELTQVPAGQMTFLIDVEMLHPYFRIHTVETALHDRIPAPVVVFYPGRRGGSTGLSFLGIYPVDGNYRSTLVGGAQ